jgi:hypothetical protein
MTKLKALEAVKTHITKNNRFMVAYLYMDKLTKEAFIKINAPSRYFDPKTEIEIVIKNIYQVQNLLKEVC